MAIIGTGKIITKMPMINEDRIDWFAATGIEVVVENSKYKDKKFKILKVKKRDKLTILSLSCNGKYIGDLDCGYMRKGKIDVLFEKVRYGIYTAHYSFDETMRTLEEEDTIDDINGNS